MKHIIQVIHFRKQIPTSYKLNFPNEAHTLLRNCNSAEKVLDLANTVKVGYFQKIIKEKVKKKAWTKISIFLQKLPLEILF